MPFPSAHPAAVLPFRRYCPHLLSFPALLIGSLIPDSSYAFHRGGIADFAHHFLGSFGFDLPVGLVVVYLFFLLRAPAATFMPNPFRELFLPLCRTRPAPGLAIVLSLLLGIWTHLCLDAATHADGWLVLHLKFMQAPLLHIGRHLFRTSDVVWYACTFFGTGWLGFVYVSWLERVTRSPKLAATRTRLGYGLLFALLVLPFAAAHRSLHSFMGVYVGLGCTVLVESIFALAMVKVAGAFVPSEDKCSPPVCRS